MRGITQPSKNSQTNNFQFLELTNSPENWKILIEPQSPFSSFFKQSL